MKIQPFKIFEGLLKPRDIYSRVQDRNNKQGKIGDSIKAEIGDFENLGTNPKVLNYVCECTSLSHSKVAPMIHNKTAIFFFTCWKSMVVDNKHDVFDEDEERDEYGRLVGGDYINWLRDWKKLPNQLSRDYTDITIVHDWDTDTMINADKGRNFYGVIACNFMPDHLQDWINDYDMHDKKLFFQGQIPDYLAELAHDDHYMGVRMIALQYPFVYNGVRDEDEGWHL